MGLGLELRNRASSAPFLRDVFFRKSETYHLIQQTYGDERKILQMRGLR